MKRYFAFALLIAFFLLVLYSFQTSNSYLTITADDIKLNIPKGFPKPLYNFENNKLTPEVFILGRKLFYDPILSKDYSTSCASCHMRIAAFAHIDHPLSHGIRGLIGKRNVPALQNLIWKDAFMLDGGVNNLEVQPVSPITNPIEMDETMADVVSKLQKNKAYVELFRQAYHDTAVTSERMLKALTQFTGLMISSNSRYDKYMRGEDTLSASEFRGLKLFRQNCENCHTEPLFTDNSYRNIGLKPDTALRDSGRMAITGLPGDYMKFKVPSLRNVEMTYPYMHDGRFKNLKQVLDHYATGSFYTDNYDKSIERNVGLTEGEKSELIAFLKTLTDKQFLYDRRFADPSFY